MSNNPKPPHISSLACLLLSLLLLTSLSCRRTPRHEIEAMDRAEALMESHPDSALAIMQDIDTTLLRGRADKARRALLMSMALDKNYIDTTDFRVLQPAIDYYESHGTPDQRLKTRYYQGRIFMNRGEDDAALTALLRAAQDSASCSDSLAIARLCISLGHLAAIQFNYDDYIKNNLHAANIYHQSHNELCEMQCVGRALDGAATIADKDLIDSILIEYGSAIPKYFDEIEYLPNAMLVAYIVSKPDGELKELLIEVDSLQNKSSETLLDLSMGWTRLGDANKALSYLPPLDNIHSASDSLKYKGIRNDILELSGNDKQLLSGYKEILINFEDFVNVRFRDSIMFTAQKFEIESQAEKKLLKKERSKKWYIALIIVSLAIILMLVKLNYNKNRKYNTLYKTYEETLQKIEWEKNKLTDVKVKNEELRRVVNKRLKSINNLMAIKIRGEEFDYESLDKELNDIHDNQADFLASLREFFQGYYGDFLGDNIDPPLTITELNYLSLLSIGLNTRDVAAYLKIKAIYNITYRIRKKLGLPADVTNLSDYLQMQFSNS